MSACLYQAKQEPLLEYRPSPSELQGLKSALPQLNTAERYADWGKELHLAHQFARSQDWYRAVTCYKRAQFLLPKNEELRQLEIEYNLILCYWLGGKPELAITHFENSHLNKTHKNFPATQDLMVVLADCYQKTGQSQKAKQLVQKQKQQSVKKSQQMAIYQDFAQGDWQALDSKQHPLLNDFQPLLDQQEQKKKSPKTAKALNALLPGAGYLYVGQKQTAATSLMLNGLFIATALRFFDKGYSAAGLLTLSFEMGWYLGGIQGAGQAAEQYNRHLLDSSGQKILHENKGFPFLMIEYGF